MARSIPIAVMPHIGGWHLGSWRRPNSRAEDFWDPALWVEIAQIAEAAKLDAVFYGDNYSLIPVPEHLRHLTGRTGAWDAVTISAAVAMATSNIGIVATAFTEFVAPYALARQFATLDRIAGGRVGWNVVTSGTPGDKENYSAGPLGSSQVRYERAAEYVEVVKGLWDTWEDDAIVCDREAGVYYRREKMHTLDHHGKYFDVAGPLNVMRSPQGQPVIAQAGGSPEGRQLAGTIGELLFTAMSGPAAAAYRKDVREIAAAAGRDSDDLTVLAQLTPVIGHTHEEAEEKFNWLQQQVPQEILRQTIELFLGASLAEYDPDMLITELKITGGVAGYRDAVLSYRNPDGSVPTLRELFLGYKGPGTVVGTPEEIVDYMEAERANGSCDGFLLMLQGAPVELIDFTQLVVPELRRRGLLRTEYSEDTLRERLGIVPPVHRHAAT
ncbi:MAG: LLM class flavin-dependent oxidoreductase [Hyphomicrobiales bacterium]|nr:MAG: LLM class flavin-dependent oxidoreductase [Hyphomicrobiales bacterium]